jgi:PAS domain S-box-containing protein
MPGDNRSTAAMSGAAAQPDPRDAELQGLRARLAQREAELAILTSVSRGLTAEADLTTLVNLVGDKIREIFNVHVVYIALYEAATNIISFPYHVERGEHVALPSRPLGVGLTSHVIQSREPLVINENMDERAAAYGPVTVGELPKSWVGLPIISAGVVTGVISLQDLDHEHAFGDDAIQLLQAIATNLGLALHNARLFLRTKDLLRETGQRAAELEIVNDVGQALASQLDMQTLIELVGLQLYDIFQAHAVLVILFDDEKEQAQFRFALERGRRQEIPPIPIGGFSGYIRRTRQSLLIRANVAERAAEVGSKVVAGEAPRSYLGVPIFGGDRVLGVISLQDMEREGAFDEANRRLLSTIAASVGASLSNALLFDEIQRQKRYFESLVRSSPVAIVIVDLDSRVLTWNPGAERLFGYSEAEALGHNIDDLVAGHAALHAEGEGFSQESLHGGHVHTITRRSRKDGTLVDVELLTVPVTAAGDRVGYFAIYHDITELQRARQEAEAANQAKSAFLATMSHEIRTPMNAIIGMSGLLLDTPLGREQREFAEIIRNSGDALLTIINDILDFSKIEAGKMELEAAPFDLRDCLESALDVLAGKAAEKRLDLACWVEDGTPHAIVGDVTRLRQILLNLLNNAVKFTERGEVVLSVSARAVEERRYELQFAVRDTGIGIPPDRLGRLFQSFSQVDASTTRKYGGTGLGLAISKRLSELMGGTMWVESPANPEAQPGGEGGGPGSIFHFTIQAESAPALVTRAHLVGEKPRLSGRRLLVVDDNDTNRRILHLQTRAWGMQVRETASPREALEWVRRGDPFDVVILDMHMPEMDGMTLAAEIRKQRGPEALPLIMFSSLGRREIGADDMAFAAYLSKPLKQSQLFDTLADLFAVEERQPAPAAQTARPALDQAMAERLPLRILLAEDNAVNRRLALHLLGQMGYTADVAVNGLEALAALQRQRYDVVLLDVQMPEMDGLEAARQICRRWPRGERPWLIAMTANAMQGDREECLAAGMDDYVSKPIRVEALVAALEQAATTVAPPAPEAEPPAAAEEAAEDVLDPNALAQLHATAGGDEAFFHELIGTYLEDAPKLIADLRTALAQADAPLLRRAAHSLKSNSAEFGAHSLAAQCLELEALGKAGAIEEGIAERIIRVEAEYARVARALEGLQ